MNIPDSIWYEIYKFDSTFHDIFKNVIKDIYYFKRQNFKYYKKLINTKNKKKEWENLSYERKTFDDYYKIYENLPLLIQNKYNVSFEKGKKIRDYLYEKIKFIIQYDFMSTVNILQYEINKCKNLYELFWI